MVWGCEREHVDAGIVEASRGKSVVGDTDQCFLIVMQDQYNPMSYQGSHLLRTFFDPAIVVPCERSYNNPLLRPPPSRLDFHAY